MKRIGVLLSGRGSNFEALAESVSAGRIPNAEIAIVVSNQPDALGLKKAEARGIPTRMIPSKGLQREAYDRQVAAVLQEHKVDLICLAGYMRLLGPGFLRAFGPTDGTRGCPRVMNVHPGLLPSFPGLHAQRQALTYGARFAGCTVHFVDEGTDTGPIIAQAVVPVLDGDGEEALSARILAEEHRLYPKAVGWFAAGRLSLEGRRVRVEGARGPELAALRAPWDE